MDLITQAFVDKLKTDPNVIDIKVSNPNVVVIKAITSLYNNYDISQLLMFNIKFDLPNKNKIFDLEIILHEETYSNLDNVIVEEYENAFMMLSEIEMSSNDYDSVFFLDQTKNIVIKLKNHSLVESITVPVFLKDIQSEVLKIEGVISTRFYDLYDETNKILFVVVKSGNYHYVNSLSPIDYYRFIYQTGNMIPFYFDKTDIISKEVIVKVINETLKG
jgi:hypothetical protein